jgi:hypothetical protein
VLESEIKVKDGKYRLRSSDGKKSLTLIHAYSNHCVEEAGAGNADVDAAASGQGRCDLR